MQEKSWLDLFRSGLKMNQSSANAHWSTRTLSNRNASHPDRAVAKKAGNFDCLIASGGLQGARRADNPAPGVIGRNHSHARARRGDASNRVERDSPHLVCSMPLLYFCSGTNVTCTRLTPER